MKEPCAAVWFFVGMFISIALLATMFAPRGLRVQVNETVYFLHLGK